MNEQSNQKVFLNGYIDVPTDRLQAVEAALVEHISLTRAEPGCISFHVTPCDKVNSRFNVAEVFIDQQAFDFHQQRTKQSAWFKATEGIPRDYKTRTGD